MYSNDPNTGLWHRIKQDWEIPDSYPVSSERVIAAFKVVKEELGQRWLVEKVRGTGLARSLRALDVVYLGEALASARATSAHKLLRKLGLAPGDSVWLAEAHVIGKLLPTSDSIQYEPRAYEGEKRPDILQRVGELSVQYEVARPARSERDKQREQVITKWAEDIAEVFAAGALDVYLRECELNRALEQEILTGVKQIQRETRCAELHVEQGVCLVFDPSGSVATAPTQQERKILIDGTVMGGDLDCGGKDRRLPYRKLLGFNRPSPGLIRFEKSRAPNQFTNFKLIRVFAETTDARAVLKVIEEASQLCAESPSFVVLQMGGPAADIREWADLVYHEFKAVRHGVPSALWLREFSVGHEVFAWREVVVTNPHASCPVPRQILASIVGEEALAKALVSSD